VRLEGDTLIYQRQGGPEVRLQPMGDHTFAFASTKDTRVRFEPAGERFIAVRAVYSDGASAVFPRTR
jgi:hypothetical protein